MANMMQLGYLYAIKPWHVNFDITEAISIPKDTDHDEKWTKTCIVNIANSSSQLDPRDPWHDGLTMKMST